MLQSGAAKVNELVTLHGAIPRGLMQIGIIVDDLVVMEQILLSELDEDGKMTRPCESLSRQQLARKGYADAKLKTNPSKAFTGDTCASFCGVDIGGKKGIMRASQKRLWPTMVLTLRVCSLGLCTMGLLEVLAGMWVSLLGVRRRLFSILDLVFDPLRAINARGTVIRMSEELVDELCCTCVLGTLAAVNLRAQYANFVVATDASNEAMAGVRAPCSPAVSAELSRHCLRKGIWAKLLPPGRALLREHGLLDDEEQVPDESYRTNPLWEVVARALRYHETWRREIRRKVHINVSELRAYVEEEKRIANATPSLRCPFGNDSQVTLGAVVKGRAASRQLNRVLPQSMGYAIGGDVYTLPMCFNTASNRADGPTRRRDPDPPDLEVPEWYSEIENGDATGFDRWMDRHGVPAGETALPFHEISGCQDVDLRPHSAGRSAEWRRQAPRKEDKKDQPKEEVGGLTEAISKPAEKPKTTKPLKLPAEAVELLESFPQRQFFFRNDEGCFTEPGMLDLFSGRFGVAKQAIKFGAPWVLTFEWNRSSSEDLRDDALREKLMKMIRLGCFKVVGAAPICSSFSVAVTPPVRSSKYPRGMPGLRAAMREKVKDGNGHNDWLADMILLLEELGFGYYVENPDCSWWWRERRWKKFRAADSGNVFRLTFCRFGTPWKKATRIATNTRLMGARMMCCCKREHVRLRGQHPTKKIPWTLVAQPYPTGLCRLLAIALCQHARWCGIGRLDVAGCSRTGSLRCGEASNPGPRRSNPHTRVEALQAVRLLSGQTQALETKLLREFVDWCGRSMPSVEVEDLFRIVPQFLADVLVAYAEHMYQNGGALSNLRHLILAAQRWIPAVRPLTYSAWEMAERWETLCPVNHRTPIPDTVVNAMCVVAWNLKWYGWVGATVLSFYGAGRLGEVLKCSREDLVLPSDVFEPDGKPVFLRLRKFKSKGRQPARVQHMKISDRNASLLLSRIFRNLPLDEPLFGTTSYQYRSRWDCVLKMLGIAKEFALTPGGLRGGAAVCHYKNGKPINDLLWLLRLRSQITLESYLQEVSALNLFSKLSAPTRETIKIASSFFAFLGSGDCTLAG